ncbi:hypothetical protein [Paraconexibacter algicola]|uniref:hypothetical protein n=1 Tax=Paraconexibacter algicola TaxID=2133960 RepID=UPI0011B25276|nr:hypothetical protein [Paraconexibacter algicola]
MLSRLPRAAATSLALAALLPGVAAASTYTVDDDRLDCPNAGFTSIQAAVQQASPHDTVVICAGLYLESSFPASGANSPSQTGSRNGLTITKPLTLLGAGADKVTIRPAAALGPTLAGSAPYLRDGGGNVITVSRQAGGSSDFDENFTTISGVTVESPTIYAEAGIAFFNTSGVVRNSRVGPLLRAADATELAARPHGWGIVQTNHLVGASEGTIRREVTVERTLVTGYQAGGILFDDARGTDGSATTTQRSGIRAYGRVVQSTVTGSGPDTLIPQTGIRYHAGHRGEVTKSVITGNSYTPDARQSVGVLLTDAETGPDPSNPAVRALTVYDNVFTGNGYGAFNANATNDAVRQGAPAAFTPGTLGLENWWGCNTGPIVGAPSSATCQGISGDDTTPAASIERGTTRTSQQVLTALQAGPVPGVTADALPTASIDEPLGGGTIVAGVDAAPVVVAADDFGVKSVALSVDGGTPVVDGKAPYDAFSYTPGFDQLGDTVTFTAVVTDASNQTRTVTSTVRVVPPAGYVPLSVDPGSYAAGPVTLGAATTTTVTATNSGENPVTLAPPAVTGSGFAIRPTGTTCADGLVLAPDETCTVALVFAPTAAGDATGGLTLAYTAKGGGGPATTALTGTGVAPTPTPIPTPDPPAPSPTPAAPAPAPTPVPVVSQDAPITVAFAAPSLRTRMTKAGSARFRVLCPASATGICRGTVTLRGILRGTTASTVGSASFALRPGRAATIVVPLVGAARSKIRRTGRLTVAARVRARDGGRPLTGTAVLVVRR